MGLQLLYISIRVGFLKNSKCYLSGSDNRKRKKRKEKELLSHSLSGDRIEKVICQDQWWYLS